MRPPDPARRGVSAKEVADELLPGTSVPLLQELHLLTRDGSLNADSRRKLKQINHLVGLLRPAVDAALAAEAEPIVVDCGAGKSYLGFLLYQIFLGAAGRGQLIAVESRAELAAATAERAGRFGFGRMSALASPIATAPIPERVAVVTALHACDTATDDALFLAIRHGAEHVAVVPCCQAEVARQLAGSTVESGIKSLFAHPWHRREFGSHLTNVVRALCLEASGYRVTVTELAGWEHALKNELILARKTRPEGPNARERLASLLAATGVRPQLAVALGFA